MMTEPDWSQWVGRTERSADHAVARPVRELAATFDEARSAETGDIIPNLWHWIYFPPLAPMSQIAANGHEKLGEFLPPLPLERRMWAGGRLTFHDPLRIGDAIEKKSEIMTIAEKEGKSGRMAFVTVKHEIGSPRGLAVIEEQDIAYIETPKVFAPPKPIPLPENLAWREPYRLDPVMLFRFSAVTFNGHRIHYDLRYTTEVEKYPGLVVHGPLQAMLLMRAAEARHPGKRAARYSFRGVRPLFDFDTLFLCGKEGEGSRLDLFTSNGDGHVCVQAALGWRE
jgi:3-methylfumaryl-CoA hydratase